MLQALNTVHTVSVAHHTLYFGCLVLIALVVCPGWYVLGVLNSQAILAVSPAPTTPARPRCVFRRQSHALLLLIARLVILAMAEAKDDLIIFTLAIKVT